MRVAVTGATGGIGRGLVPLLAAKGCDVIALGRNQHIGKSLQTSRVRFHAIDLVYDEITTILDDIDVVVHLAARSAPWGRRSDFVRDNVVATARLLDAMRKAGVGRLVHASTPTIFSERRDRLELCGASIPSKRAVNHYAETKLTAERMVLSRPQLSTIVLRPSAVVGPHDTAILPRIMRAIRRGILPVGKHGVLFHPTAARDAAEAFATAATGDVRGCFNVAGPEPVSVEAMAHTLASMTGVTLRIPVCPEPMLHASGLAGEMAAALIRREPPITRYTANILSWSRTFNISETSRILGWSPSTCPIDALARAVAA